MLIAGSSQMMHGATGAPHVCAVEALGVPHALVKLFIDGSSNHTCSIGTARMRLLAAPWRVQTLALAGVPVGCSRIATRKLW